MERLFASLIISFITIVFTPPSFAGTTCGPPIGEVVSFQAMANDRYVTADKLIDIDNPPVVANRDVAQLWEQFEVEDTGGGYIALKALANGLYVSADIDTADGKLYANKEKDQITGKLDDTERFFRITNPDGTISLISKANGRYVAADLNKSSDAPLHANRDWNRTWERFKTTVSSPTTPPERFVDNGDGTICDHETGLMWEKKILDGTFDPNEFDQPLWSFVPNSIYNGYSWSAEGDQFNTPTGTVFTDFLARLNIGRFAGYSDWRIPTREEGRTLFSEPDPIGQNCTGELGNSTDPLVCTHPVFGPDRGTWVVANMLSNPGSVPRDYNQFQWPVPQGLPGVPAHTPVRAVRGSMQ